MKEIQDKSKDNRKLCELIKKQLKRQINAKIDKEDWEAHFKNLYEEKTREDRTPKVTREREERHEYKPTYDEFLETVHKLRLYKAAGPDEISNELVKNGGKKLLQRLCNHISRIWEEEKMPREWKNGRLIPIYKKGGSLISQAKIRGLIINQDKTKFIRSSRKNVSKNTFLQIDPDKFQEVEEFKCLEVTITGGNDRNKEIKERIKAGNEALWSFQRILRGKYITKQTKWQ